MNYLSLFSGMEAAHLAWHPLGWTCKGVAEIELAPCTVLAHRLGATEPRYLPDAPDFDRKRYRHIGAGDRLPNFGDVSQVTDDDIAALGPVDVVIGGSPCQDLSIAGKRAGLAGARSGLFHEQLRIFHAARHLCGARFLIWENVPGAFSSNAGRDFAVVAGSMAGLDLVVPEDGWGSEGVAVGEHGLVEWSILDAQWFGVAQRRRRVFVVLDTGDWAGRSPILLERDGMRGDHPPVRQAGKGFAGGAAERAGSGDERWPAEVASTLNAKFGDKQGLEDQHALNGAPLFVPDTREVMGTLTARMMMSLGSRDVEDGAVIAVDTYNASLSDVSPTLCSNGDSPAGNGAVLDVAHTLRSSGFDASEDGTGRGTPIVPVSVALRGREGGSAIEVGDDCAFALRASQGGGDKPHVLAFSCKDSGADANDDLSPTLRAMGKSESHANAGGGGPGALAHVGMAVRRLTPRECERLQGAPDDWTLVPNAKGKFMSDGPRYKMLGNSFAVPVIRWIGQQLDRVVAEGAQA